MKKCGNCWVMKSKSHFCKNRNMKSGLDSTCKECKAEYYKANRDKILARSISYRSNNRDKVTAYATRYYNANRDKTTTYRSANMRKIRQRRSAYQSRRLQDDPLFRLITKLRKHSRRAKLKFGLRSRTAQLLGCTWEHAQIHLILSALANYGMYYEGMSLHIDHIMPLSSAKTAEEAIKLCHYTNLQYLTPEDNLTKSDKLPENL